MNETDSLHLFPANSLPPGVAMAPSQALAGVFDPVPQAPLAQAQAVPGAARLRQGFRVGELRLMVRYEDGSELTEVPAIFSLPNAPHWFCGVANLHGLLTPVFDLAGFIGLQTDPRSRRMLLVLSRGNDAAGLLIDGLPQRLRWSPEQDADTSVASPRLAGLLSGAATIGDELWFDLDCAALLDALEQAIGQPH